MTNKKDRTQSDIPGDHVLHFFEKILQQAFLNPSYNPPEPSPNSYGDIDKSECAEWDPNDCKIFNID